MSPLNWGIGHAARLVPIANHLHTNGAEVFICASGAALELMRLECAFAKFVEDVPFEVTYSSSAWNNGLKLLLQLPKMWLQVYKEHQLLKKIVEQYQIDLVISDNRYGFYHQSIPSVFITHQLNIQVPLGKGLVNYINHTFIKKFDACWVPDFEQNEIALAGMLSRNNKLRQIHYIGPLSRALKAKESTEIKAPVLYLLSGVEPQRSILEQLILKRHAQYPHQAILIRGTTQTKTIIKPQNNLIVYDICTAKQLQSLVAASKYVVCRSGYSSIMDLVLWQKNAVLIPTPGQYEQEYLAQYLSGKKWFYSINQDVFLQFQEEAMQAYQCPIIERLDTNYDNLIKNLF